MTDELELQLKAYFSEMREHLFTDVTMNFKKPMDQLKSSYNTLFDVFVLGFKKIYEDSQAENYKRGYVDALNDYGIWKDGVQRIGCMETPIKDVIAAKFGDK